ncbi:MAG: hypothetical protein CMP10_21290 [Zetaproteobacteria bacterium]|nr:hypothetical protein [Pseudobdellovibrionaceae bacterium]
MSYDNQTKSYWLEAGIIEGQTQPPQSDPDAICVIGSGIVGVSTAYYLLKAGMKVTLIDFETTRAASFRNASHVLLGTVESYAALSALHGKDIAKQLWQLSIDVCQTLENLVEEHQMDVDYRKNGYLVMAIDETENQELKESIRLLNADGFNSSYVDANELEKMGFRSVFGARFEQGSAQVHPVKLRNAILNQALQMGLSYHSGIQVESVEEVGGLVEIGVKKSADPLRFMSAVIATNAYSPLLSRYFDQRRLLEPFAGQIIVSEPLKQDIPISYPHSFDHGYEYAIKTDDNRLLIGGWRNNVEGQEIGSYDLKPREDVNDGLKDFVARHYQIREPIKWEYSWKGIMATSSTGFPFIGPTSSPLIYTCSGFTGHGMSWGCGSAKLLVDIMVGNKIPNVVREQCTPKT